MLFNRGTFSQANALGGLDAFDLQAGTYRVSVDLASGRDDTPANYLLRISTLESATALTIGTTVSAERALSRQTDLYEFDATAGDRFYIAVAATSANRVPALKLIDPLGQQVSVVSGRPNTYETALTGTYRLAVVAPTGLTADAAADTYDVSVTPISSVADQTSALTFGQPVTSTISSPGESRIFNFTVDQYGSYFVDSLTNTRSLALNLTNEQGTSFLNRFFNSLDSFDRYPVLNLAPGNYSITVTGTGDFVGDFGFTFTPVDSATTIVPNSPQAISIAGVETVAFKFDAAEGDSFFFDVVDGVDAANVWYSLVDPDGLRVFQSNRLRDFSTQPLPTTGSYTLLVEGRINNTDPQTFSINLRPTGNPVTAVTLGDRITTSLTAGSSATYTFDINEGDAFVLDSLVTENVGVNFVVFDPLGQQIYQANTNIDSGPTTALFSGTYSVVLENTLQTDASLAFRLAPVTDLVIQEGDIINAEFIEQNALSIHRLISEGENLVLRPIRDKQFSTASSFNNVSQFLTTDQGGTEDGYLGVAAAYEDLEFRENAASSIVLVTDQDRDIVRQDLTFDSLVQTLFERDIALSVIVDGDFDDANGNAALGIQNNLNTFVADGNGGFIEEPGGVINGADGQSEADYIDLAFALNGVAYDLNELREGGDRADSFTEAFVEVSTRAISDQFGLTVIPSSPNFNFEKLDWCGKRCSAGRHGQF